VASTLWHPKPPQSVTLRAVLPLPAHCAPPLQTWSTQPQLRALQSDVSFAVQPVPGPKPPAHWWSTQFTP
jgi:hypothetical protein